jgi:2-methylcitrate dehydratase
MNLAERLADYAASLRYGDLDERVISEAKKRVLDSIGCALGAYAETPVKAARRLAERVYGGGSATLLGTRKKATPDMATFVNGVMVRYFDFNDTYLSKEPGHPSDNIPACLAAAEAGDKTGRDLLVAIVLAYEVQCRLCDAADIRHRGWDHVCYGLVSGALAAGKLMGLSKGELVQAVNISLNSHLAMRQVRAGELSTWKGFSFANASRNAVFSGLLAREGVTGPSPIFEGEMGFFRQVSGPFELDVGSFGGRGRPFKLEDTFVKYFPAEYHAQTAVWASLEIRGRLRSDPMSDVSSVEVKTHEAGYTILAKDEEKWAPATRETADHSLPYIVAVALVKGRLDHGSYSPKSLKDPDVMKFMKRIIVEEEKGLTDDYPRSIANRITVRLTDGTVLSEQVDVPKGHPRNAMTEGEVQEKFRALARRRLTPAQIEKTMSFVGALDGKSDVSGLFSSIVVE